MFTISENINLSVIKNARLSMLVSQLEVRIGDDYFRGH